MSAKEHIAALFPKTAGKTASSKFKKASSILILGGLIVSGATLAFLLRKPLISLVTNPQQAQNWMQSPLGPLMFVGIRTVQTVLTILPAEAVEIGAGYAFGPFWGLLWCTIGSAAGTAIIYFFTRFFGVRLVSRLIPMEKLCSLPFLTNTRQRNLLTFLLFIIPGTPKDTLTYLIGLTPMPLPVFLVISSVARIPSILTSTLCGTALGSQKYLTAGVIFGVTTLVSLVGFFIYRRMSKKEKTAGMKPSNTAHATNEVNIMANKYPDLYTLMEQDTAAKAYFSSLPDYVQEQISTRARHVNSMESLQDYAENLLRGDD